MLLNTPLPEPVVTASPEPVAEDGSQTAASPGRNGKRRKNDTVPVVPERKPVVTIRIPEEGRQALEQIWSQCSNIPSTWNTFISKEESL